jgi:hypothetical protein
MSFEKLVERALPADIRRRTVFKAGGAAGCGLLIGIGLSGLISVAEAAKESAEFAPNA